ncbi:flavodoxin family protein [Treponema sp. OMZ 840]|uniref:flavodoxin family protein n=1 Tax=Treponema sp. OMZ 840 TaxID=244313 RepID=UPI003D8BEE23
MKTVIINGSPHKNGHTAALIREMTSELNGEIKQYNAYDMKIGACIDCKYCFKKPGCSIKDDMESFCNDMENADVFIVASPMHFGIVSAPLFTLATRLQRYWPYKNGKRNIPDTLSPKVGCLLMTTGGKWVNMELLSDGAVNFIFDHTNTKTLGSIYAYQTDCNAADTQLDVLAEVRRTAQRINGMVSEKSFSY